MITFRDYEGKCRCCYCFKEVDSKVCDCEEGKVAAVANEKLGKLVRDWNIERKKMNHSDPEYKERYDAFREAMREIKDEFPAYDKYKVLEYMKNPDRKSKMTEDNIRELQNILVQTCIDYINEHHLSDLEEVHFNADSLQCSADYKEWTPATDSAISCYGLRLEGYTDSIQTRYEIGSWC